MRGYGPGSYGDGFADVYDDWYADVTDVAATVARVLAVTQFDRADVAAPRVLELGVGTGRLAIPLARAGCAVTGIDASEAMLDRLCDTDSEFAVTIVHGDMVDDLPDGPFDVVLVAYNTIFNLLDSDRQQACFAAVAARLASGGAFVVEAFVPDDDPARARSTSVDVRSLAADRVVLSVTVDAPGDQRAEGQFVELTEAGGVRLRPWSIRWATPAQLDAMAVAVGLTLAERFADMAGDPFTPESTTHVSVYRADGLSG